VVGEADVGLGDGDADGERLLLGDGVGEVDTVVDVEGDGDAPAGGAVGEGFGLGATEGSTVTAGCVPNPKGSSDRPPVTALRAAGRTHCSFGRIGS
jgi:hypothetical protein